MRSCFLRSSDQTNKLVRHYLQLSSSYSEHTDRFIPDGNVALVFNFVDNNASFMIEENIPLPYHFITLPAIKSLKIKTAAYAESFIVICKASVFTRLFNIQLRESDNFPFSCVDLFNNFPMYNMLKDLSTFHQRVAFFESYLIEKSLLNKYEFDEIDEVYEDIMNSKGDIKISELMNNLAMNPRSFRRKFTQRVGISTKELLRIVRVNYVWNLCRDKNQLDFLNVVYNCHYFDQSHFIHDFKKIVGETPCEFFRRELNVVEFLSGKQSTNPEVFEF
ncbi:MAG: helix-turn-helix domain-containing protein [Melioribacteraceae bacterium]|nr:helix-turn-helix domain-containing protein [Melioribacteraceae bacterium]